MNIKSTLAVLAAALFLAMPLATAEWKGQGFYEPDTAFDKTSGMMFSEPGMTGRPLYFNGALGQTASAVTTTINPNVAALGTSHVASPVWPIAILGEWIDCNSDGYMGLAEGASNNYSSLLLSDASRCPETSGPYGTVYNDGTSVREFIPLRVTDPATDDTRVWADYGRPTDAGTAACPLTPIPRGTTGSTGGLLRYADCIDGWRVTGAINAVASATGLMQLSFADAEKHRPDQSGSALNVKSPWGQEGDASMVTAFDCDAPVSQHDDTKASHVFVDDPTGGELSGSKAVPGVGSVRIFGTEDHRFHAVNASDKDYNVFIAGAPQVPSVNPSGSPGGTVNETEEATGVTDGSCDRDDDNNAALLQGYGPGPASQEGDHVTISGKRTQSDGAMTQNAAWVWRGHSTYAASKNGFVNIDTLQPRGPYHVTYYARVSTMQLGGLDSPSSNAGTYGSAHCAGLTEITGAFECDPAKWWVGTGVSPVWRVAVGAPYNLIDVDCYDEGVRGFTPPAVLLTGTECAR